MSAFDQHRQHLVGRPRRRARAAGARRVPGELGRGALDRGHRRSSRTASARRRPRRATPTRSAPGSAAAHAASALVLPKPVGADDQRQPPRRGRPRARGSARARSHEPAPPLRESSSLVSIATNSLSVGIPSAAQQDRGPGVRRAPHARRRRQRRGRGVRTRSHVGAERGARRGQLALVQSTSPTPTAARRSARGRPRRRRPAVRQSLPARPPVPPPPTGPPAPRRAMNWSSTWRAEREAVEEARLRGSSAVARHEREPRAVDQRLDQAPVVAVAAAQLERLVEALLGLLAAGRAPCRTSRARPAPPPRRTGRRASR